MKSYVSYESNDSSKCLWSCIAPHYDNALYVGRSHFKKYSLRPRSTAPRSCTWNDARWWWPGRRQGLQRVNCHVTSWMARASRTRNSDTSQFNSDRRGQTCGSGDVALAKTMEFCLGFGRRKGINKYTDRVFNIKMNIQINTNTDVRAQWLSRYVYVFVYIYSIYVCTHTHHTL